LDNDKPTALAVIYHLCVFVRHEFQQVVTIKVA